MEKQEKLNRLLWNMRWLVLRQARLESDPRRFKPLVESGDYWHESMEISRRISDTGQRINRLKRQMRRRMQSGRAARLSTVA
jgi:hypothetical protein